MLKAKVKSRGDGTCYVVRVTWSARIRLFSITARRVVTTDRSGQISGNHRIHTDGPARFKGNQGGHKICSVKFGRRGERQDSRGRRENGAQRCGAPYLGGRGVYESYDSSQSFTNFLQRSAGTILVAQRPSRSDQLSDLVQPVRSNPSQGEAFICESQPRRICTLAFANACNGAMQHTLNFHQARNRLNIRMKQLTTNEDLDEKNL